MEARRLHDETAARLAAHLDELQRRNEADPAYQAMIDFINQRGDALAGDPLAEEAIRHLSLS